MNSNHEDEHVRLTRGASGSTLLEFTSNHKPGELREQALKFNKKQSDNFFISGKVYINIILKSDINLTRLYEKDIILESRCPLIAHGDVTTCIALCASHGSCVLSVASTHAAR